jgi:hypothetical protein
VWPSFLHSSHLTYVGYKTALLLPVVSDLVFFLLLSSAAHESALGTYTHKRARSPMHAPHTHVGRHQHCNGNNTTAVPSSTLSQLHAEVQKALLVQNLYVPVRVQWCANRVQYDTRDAILEHMTLHVRKCTYKAHRNPELHTTTARDAEGCPWT